MTAIFFDSNPPVTTNTVINTIVNDPVVSVDAGADQKVYLGYSPTECVVLTANASDGLPPYTFVWSNGDTGQTINVCPTQTTTFSITATYADGCPIAVDSVTVSVVDIRCGKNNDKVVVCHTPPGNPEKAKAICIDQSDVANHLAHGCKLDSCAAAFKWNGSQKQENNEPELTDFETRYSLRNTIEIFPNPNTGQFTILMMPESVLGASVSLYNILGEVIYKNDKITYHYINIDISDSPKGIYFIKVSNDKDVFRGKLMHQ